MTYILDHWQVCKADICITMLVSLGHMQNIENKMFVRT
jgi:hypothetical protein